MADSDIEQGSTDKIVSIVEDTLKRLTDAEAKEKGFPQEEMPKLEKKMQKMVKDLNDIKDFLLKYSQHSACALVRTVLEGILEDLNQIAIVQGAVLAAKLFESVTKLERLEKNVTKLKTQIKVDPEEVKHSTIPKLHEFIIPIVLSRLELVDNYKQPKLANDLQNMRSWIQQLQEKELGADDISNLVRWETDLKEIERSLNERSDHSAGALVRAVLESIHQILSKKAEDQKVGLATKLERLEKNVTELKTQIKVDRSSETVSGQVHKLTNDLQYVGILIKQLQENRDNLDREVKDFQGKVGEIANALVQHSYIDNLEADKLQEKLEILTRLVVKLKQQISSRNQSSRTGPDSNPYTQVGEEIAAAQANKILPVLHLYKSLHETPGFNDFREVYKRLERKEKMCLLYFALIPENEIVRKRFMTYWWVGEGLIGEGLDGEEGTIEDIGGKILGKLVDEGCIEPENKEHRSVAGDYKMNPFIRSVVIQLAREAKFCALGSKGNVTSISPFSNLACLVDGFSKEILDRGSGSLIEKQDKGSTLPLKKQDKGFRLPLKKQDKGSGLPSKKEDKGSELPLKKQDKGFGLSLEKQDKGSKLSLEKQDKVSELPSEKQDKGSELPFEKLQTIFNVNEPYPDVFKLEWFPKMKNVKVLYLGRWQASPKHHIEVESIDFLQGLKHMKLLRFLSLQGMSRIERLHPSIGDLLNLRILDLRACHSLEELPDQIGKLKRLTHLDLSECYLLERMPRGISSLKRLEVLKGFIVRSMPGRKDGTFWSKPLQVFEGFGWKYCALEDLSALKNLRKLSIYTNREDFPNDTDVKDLHSFEKLQKLTITWGAGETTKNGGENQKQDKSRRKSNAAKAPSPKNGGQKQTSPPNRNPKNDGDGDKQGERHAQPKNNGDSQESDKRPAQQIEETTTSLESCEYILRKLEKLDLKCYPRRTAPNWLRPKQLPKLKKLYIRGGELHNLNPVQENEKWEVKILRLKFLCDLKLDWKKLESSFPKLAYLEAFDCPKLTFLPFNEKGVPKQ